MYNDIWNWDYIQQQQAQYHQNQISQVFECTIKMREFLDSMDKVDPEYKSMAAAQVCTVLIEYANRLNNR